MHNDRCTQRWEYSRTQDQAAHQAVFLDIPQAQCAVCGGGGQLGVIDELDIRDCLLVAGEDKERLLGLPEVEVVDVVISRSNLQPDSHHQFTALAPSVGSTQPRFSQPSWIISLPQLTSV